jgi:hypothetical protein
MKKFTSLLFILCLFIISSIVVIQPVQATPPCGSPLITGCIGACGAPFLASYRVVENGAYCFTTTGSSLCPNTGAVVTIYLNGELELKEDMTYGIFHLIRAKEGDVIRIEANLFGIDNSIVCPWLGELYFELGRLGKRNATE